MSPTVVTFLFESANFLVLAAVLGWLFFRPVRQAIADHRAKFEADNQQAAQKLAEAETVRQQLENAHLNLQAELDTLRERELESAKKDAEKIVADAHTTAERQLRESQRRVAQITDSQRDVLGEAAAAAAAETVSELLQNLAAGDLQSALFKAACQQLASLAGSSLAPVKVESAQPLTDEQTAKLQDLLGSAVTNVEFEIVDGLGAGVRISTAQGLIDASIGGLTQFARQALAKEMKIRANSHHPLPGTNDV